MTLLCWLNLVMMDTSMNGFGSVEAADKHQTHKLPLEFVNFFINDVVNRLLRCTFYDMLTRW